MRRLVGVCTLLGALAFVAVGVTACVYETKAPPPTATSPITFSWNPTSKAEWYTLKCGLEHGRYTLPPVIVQAPATQVQTVASQPGTYFCVVTASNASGESGPSNEMTLFAR